MEGSTYFHLVIWKRPSTFMYCHGSFHKLLLETIVWKTVEVVADSIEANLLPKKLEIDDASMGVDEH